ncbi:MAG: selenium cofactor biosynthesis protein YqeC [Collinsella sp.]|nr:selenium cofactor biosynthesis protein YqeC [Collinsella sp.]
MHGLADILEATRGVTSVIGSGGKSTLLSCGARALAGRGARVVLATSTHMFPPDGIPHAETVEGVRQLMGPGRIVAAGRIEEGTGKLVAPACGLDALSAHADHVLVEADGSKRLPLKAHAAHEPVIPASSERTILVIGASGLGHPVREAVHRPEVFCSLTGAGPDDAATPELVARAVAAEGLVGAGGRDLVIVNQADNPLAGARAHELARLLAASLPCPVFLGGMRRGTLESASSRGGR